MVMSIDENVFKDSFVRKKTSFYSNICMDYNQSPLNMVVDYMFKVFDAQVDGMGDLSNIKNSLHHVFVGVELSKVDKYMNLTILLTGYESYLKKIYYLIHGETLKRTDGEEYATLSDAFMAFPSITALRCSPKQEHRLLYSEMNLLREWRNLVCNYSLDFNEKQLDSALDIVTDMYIFIIAAEMSKINKLFNTIKGQLKVRPHETE